MVTKMMKFYAPLLSALLLSTAPACAKADDMTNNIPAVESQSCAMQLDLSNPAEIKNWRVLLDGVMGGRSTGTRFAEDGAMTFKGSINTNGGGFSSLRRPMKPGALKDVESLNMRVKTDGRAYKLTFRTDATHWGRSVSYQLSIPQTAKDEWAEVTLPLTKFRTSVFGRNIRAAPFDAEQVREMGIILADGIDGPFELNLKSVRCNSTKAT